MSPYTFPLGRLYITPGAMELLDTHGALAWKLLARHGAGDWGDVDSEDWELNNKSLVDGTRILSAYVVHSVSDSKVWIITAADRSSTTLLLPAEY